MKVTIENLGPLRKAEYEVGDLTLICGENNTGKTYATYALYGFLKLWRDELLTPDLLPKLIGSFDVTSFMKSGSLKLDKLPDYQSLIALACRNYTQALPRVFGSNPQQFKGAEVKVSIPNESLSHIAYDPVTVDVSGESQFTIRLDKQTQTVYYETRPGRPFNSYLVTTALIQLLTQGVFNNPFIVSVERTGAAIFQSELDLVQIGLMNALRNANEPEKKLLFKRFFDIEGYKPQYALPIVNNISTIRGLKQTMNSESILASKHPEILEFFSEIVGGTFTIDRNSTLFYHPAGKPRTKILLNDSASSVRALLLLDVYLRHVAQTGDILIIDEPELNLHPKNQRLIARLLARLVNIGIKVFITTHSDYIVKELNTLIMLNYRKSDMKKELGTPKYIEEELLESGKVRVYIAEEGLINVVGQNRRVRGDTLTPAPINPMYGIEVNTFDTSIDDMNQIQEQLVYGDD